MYSISTLKYDIKLTINVLSLFSFDRDVAGVQHEQVGGVEDVCDSHCVRMHI